MYHANCMCRFCWRYAPDRGSSPLPRPGGPKQIIEPCIIRFCPQGVGAGLTRESSAKRSKRLSARCIRQTACAGFAGAAHQITGQGPLLRTGGQRRSLPEAYMHGVSRELHVQVLLALRARSRVKPAPTAWRPETDHRAMHNPLLPAGRGSGLDPRIERNAVATPECAVYQADRMCRFCWRCAPDRGARPAPTAWRPETDHRAMHNPLLPAGRGSGLDPRIEREAVAAPECTVHQSICICRQSR